MVIIKRILPIFIIGFLFFSCDNTIDPFEKDTGLYSIYGYLDLNKTTNYIRVRDLNVPFTADATKNLDATVRLENLSTGVTETLIEQVIEFEGIYLHNFIVNGVIAPDTKYRLTVERSDGNSVSVDVKTPARPVPVVNQNSMDCESPVEIIFDPVNGGTIDAEIVFPWNNRQVDQDGPTLIDDDENETPGKFIYTFTPQDILDNLTFVSGLTCSDLSDDYFGLEYFHYSPGYYQEIQKIHNDLSINPGGGLDFSKVLRENGIISFGAFYQDSVRFSVDTTATTPNQ